MSYQLHHLCTLFPRLAGAEFDALREDIKANGLRQPIVLHDGMILDGGNRYAACIASGVEPQFREFDGGNLWSFVWSMNGNRRHLSPGQQAAIVASGQDWAKAQNVGKPKSGNVAGLATVGERAAESGASERTQRMADKVAKADPDLARQVGLGNVSLPQAIKKISPPKKAESIQMAEPEDFDGPSLGELVEELQKENLQLGGQIKAMEADDLKAEALKWRKAYDHAVRQQSEAMDNAKRSQDREKWTARQLARCGKAIGEEDTDKIASAVEAFVRQYRKAA